jgi:hypothetical protein
MTLVIIYEINQNRNSCLTRVPILCLIKRQNRRKITKRSNSATPSLPSICSFSSITSTCSQAFKIQLTTCAHSPTVTFKSSLCLAPQSFPSIFESSHPNPHLPVHSIPSTLSIERLSQQELHIWAAKVLLTRCRPLAQLGKQ